MTSNKTLRAGAKYGVLTTFSIFVGFSVFIIYDISFNSLRAKQLPGTEIFVDEKGYYSFKAKQKTVACFGGTKCTTHATGVFGNRVVEPDLAADATTQLFLGDSMTYGMGVDGSKSFAQEYSNLTGVSVINLGVPSHAPTAHVETYRRFQKSGLRPQRVFVVVDKSDVTDEFYRWKFVDRNLLSPFLVGDGLMDNLKLRLPRTYALYRNFRLLIGADNGGNFEAGEFTHREWNTLSWGPDVREALTLYVNELTKLIAFLEQSGVKEVVIVTIPWPADVKVEGGVLDWELLHDQVCSNMKCSVVHTREFLARSVEGKRMELKALHLPNDPHLSEVGHRLVAEALSYWNGDNG